MMKDVYSNISKKYTDIVATIIADPDLEGVNFPLVIEKMNIEGLKAFLAEDIANKLDLTEEYDFNQIEDEPLRMNQPEEELKESEKDLGG